MRSHSSSFPTPSLFSARITNNKSTNFEDVVYLDLVDLDKSPNNCIVLERQDPGGGLHQDCYSCPHHIVQKVATIIKEEIGIRRRGPDFGATLMDITSIRENQVREKKQHITICCVML